MTIEQISLYNRTYHTEFQSLALSLTRDVDRAQDLLQEVSYLVIKNRNSFQPGTNFPAWVKRIIRNTFISDYRRTKRRATIIAQNRMPVGWLQDASVQNKGIGLLGEEDIRALIDQLPKVYRETFLRYFQGMSYQDIAIRSKVPVGTIKSRLFMARVLLKKQLRQYGMSA